MLYSLAQRGGGGGDGAAGGRSRVSVAPQLLDATLAVVPLRAIALRQPGAAAEAAESQSSYVVCRLVPESNVSARTAVAAGGGAAPVWGSAADGASAQQGEGNMNDFSKVTTKFWGNLEGWRGGVSRLLSSQALSWARKAEARA